MRPFILLTLIVVGCSSPPPAAKQSTTEPVAAAECAVDADCAVAELPDPARGGCCEALCERPVVTAREAERRRAAWEASCAAVRCAAPEGCGEESPVAICAKGRCAAAR
jgi:hypothetical protein